MQNINDFSTEIFQEIFSYLTLPEKQTCISVCKKWNSLILDFNFHEHLQIKKKEQLMLAVQESKFFSYQFRSLNIHIPEIDAAQAKAVLALPEKFPNLRELVWKNSKHDTDDSDKSEIIVNERVAEHWQRITRFKDANKYSLTSEILKYGGFCNLVELCTVFAGNERFEYKCNSLIQQLSNAPKLKTLKLQHAAMSLNQLHQLFCNAQQLESLWLIDIELVPVGVIEQRSLDPTSNALKELVIVDCVKAYNEKMLEQMKCPNLKSLKIISSSPRNEKYGEDQLIKFVSQCAYLETYNISIHPITPAIMEAMNSSEVESKTFKITVLPNEDPVTQINNLLKSSQSKSVVTMNINYKYYDGAMDFKVMTIIECLRQFPRLKNLKIAAKNYIRFPHFPIGAFLESFKLLETLELTHWKFQSNSNFLWNLGLKKITSNLKSLVLNRVECGNEHMQLISKACPELSRLTILPQYSQDLPNIEFPDHKFTCITIGKSDDRNYYVNGSFYEVNSQKGTECYKIVGGILEETCEKSPKSKNDQTISVKYKSCTTLKLGNAYIFQT